MVDNYYAKKLNSAKLYDVYQTQLPRVQQYLDAEIDFVRRGLRGNEKVLELGAGYGRILKELAPNVLSITGVDISADSVALGKEYLEGIPGCQLQVMDAHDLAFEDDFDVVLCLQNGLSAMKGDALNIVKQCVKALHPGGKAYFSTYNPKFWEHRLAWFQEQADKGLLGEIDFEKTKEGVIACKDGFVSRSFSESELKELALAVQYPYQIVEVDDSSLFLILEKR